MNNKDYLKQEQSKFKDDAVTYREREAAVAGLNLGVFIGAIGPLGIALLKALNSLPVGPVLYWILMSSAPATLLLTLINWTRTPADYRKSKAVGKAVFLSVGCAVATFVMATYFGLKK